ncbi:MAG TPA: sulfite exporter TauE/SafE family protein [Acidimicrobiales bacterium]|nr:sulfite exporter TauE/SafE family protein [Acidimicrobiales bacterium]
MHIDWWQTLAGGLVGIMVGITGMGGGALLTPLLILVFGINPGTAVSSDLLTSLIMRPVGGAVHVRRRTVAWRLVGWLCLGSVPAGFSGVLVLRALGNGHEVQRDVQLAIAWALVAAVASIVLKAAIGSRRSGAGAVRRHASDVRPRPLPTVAVGVAGGFMVGMTSVGSGSLMVVLLLALYPRLAAKSLVGTDLVQAVPLIAAATLGHALYGHISLGLTASLVIGSVPGIYLGARLSSSAPEGLIRPALVIVLTATALKMLGVATETVLWAAAGFCVAALIAAAVLALRRAGTRAAMMVELSKP